MVFLERQRGGAPMGVTSALARANLKEEKYGKDCS
jgi:hypothetical protein